MHRTPGLIPQDCRKADMVTNTYTPSIWVVESRDQEFKVRVGELAPGLTALSAPIEDLSLVPSVHMRLFTTTYE